MVGIDLQGEIGGASASSTSSSSRGYFRTELLKPEANLAKTGGKGSRLDDYAQLNAMTDEKVCEFPQRAAGGSVQGGGNHLRCFNGDGSREGKAGPVFLAAGERCRRGDCKVGPGDYRSDQRPLLG